jgi:spore germination protein GerM
MRPSSFAVILSLAWIGLGCGGDEPASLGERSAAAPQPRLRTTVYFLTQDGAAPLGVRRPIERKSQHARQALEALLRGPTAAERRNGIATAIPFAARLLALTLKGRGSRLAVANLTGLPPAQGRHGQEASLGMRVRVITQVARTLIGVSGIAAVEIRVGGRPWDLWTMDGRIVRAKATYDRLLGWARICGGRSPEEREQGLSRCFSALP